MLNELQSGGAINVSIILYIIVMIVLSFSSSFEIFSCFVLGKCIASWLQASKLVEGSNWTKVIEMH